jgi:hypothetical protein
MKCFSLIYIHTPITAEVIKTEQLNHIKLAECCLLFTTPLILNAFLMIAASTIYMDIFGQKEILNVCVKNIHTNVMS